MSDDVEIIEITGNIAQTRGSECSTSVAQNPMHSGMAKLGVNRQLGGCWIGTGGHQVRIARDAYCEAWSGVVRRHGAPVEAWKWIEICSYAASQVAASSAAAFVGRSSKRGSV
ncbi:hypothetical protein DFH06DRAFT_1127397 [Mycena polygramma]|nr:hypothetical protein DFH06DRAFT_1127397 [Mycena polygramma]